MKRISVMLLLAASVAMLLTGCKKTTQNDTGASQDATEASAEEAEPEAEEAAEGVFMGNPWEDVTLEDIQEKCVGVILPATAQDPVCRWNESDKMAEIDFAIDRNTYSLRFQEGDAFEDISGLYYEWDIEFDEKVNEKDVKNRRTTDADRGVQIDSTIWFDEELRTNYSLYTEAQDLDGYDSIGIICQIYGDAECGAFYPNDFLQERCDTDLFDSYDEMIAAIKPEEGYAFVELEGCDDKVLVISDGIYDNGDGNLAAIAAFFYAAREDGKIINIGNAFSYGTAYPIRCDGKKIYSGGNHEYEELAICPETGSLIVMTTIHQLYDEEGSATYDGFYRESSSFDAPDMEIDIQTEAEFFAYYEKLEGIPLIAFTKGGAQ